MGSKRHETSGDELNNCIFCKIIKGEAAASIVYEDEICLAFMDIQPVTPGHVLVVPRQHAFGLADLPTEIGGHLFQIGQKISAGLKQSPIRCEGINFFLADGAVAFQTVFHVHLHVIPRFAGDGFRLLFGPDYRILPERSKLDRLANDLKVFL
jgi:diadenosine tetraphosphate (Ap4A) HIT family hydrolase